MTTKEYFLKNSKEALSGIWDTLQGLPILSLEQVAQDKTVLVIVDMINGFVREGALQSPRVDDLIPAIATLSEACDKYNVQKLAFADNHTMASPEFSAYPPHCLAGTSESEIVDEIKAVGGYRLIAKNSTNGFLEAEFMDWMQDNQDVVQFIVVGDCTDICIRQFAVSLKTWFNLQDIKSRIIVPISAVDTYDLGLHQGDLMHMMALYGMLGDGIEVVSDIV